MLVTGGAGFIGSNLADAFLAEGHEVRVLDDLSTGFAENVPDRAELIEAGVADREAVVKAVDGAELVVHLAAHRAVLRSVEDPLATDTANTHGTLTVLKSAIDAGVRRVVYASSSSIYGVDPPMPTPETAPARPLSPYGVSKLAGEHYNRVFAQLYGLETVSFRYFNVFGPRQRPDSAYAAVIPLFIEALTRGEAPVVHGDGGQRRAFTYIDDVVAANLAAAAAPADVCAGQVYNIANDESHTLLELLDVLGRILGVTPAPTHVDPRPGDIRNSRADIAAARAAFGFEPRTGFEEGLRRAVDWFWRREQR
ncbi:MAG TPA: NAD-dependent epimerase/dehydratase family protein [Acidimicrobiales bacterium]|nr:NAD-dependent epimerase/dehydratase family protein [Acidimicrobiales bacterium]